MLNNVLQNSEITPARFFSLERKYYTLYGKANRQSKHYKQLEENLKKTRIHIYDHISFSCKHIERLTKNKRTAEQQYLEEIEQLKSRLMNLETHSSTILDSSQKESSQNTFFKYSKSFLGFVFEIILIFFLIFYYLN